MNMRHVNRLDELAQDQPPSRDLWPAIAQAIEAEKAAAAVAGNAARRFGWRPAAGLAAAVVLLAIGVLIGRGIAPTNPVPIAGTQVPPSVSGVIPASLRDAEYHKQREQLLVQVQARLATMPALERAKVAASLDTLKRSIGEIEAALGHDPANALLQELFVNSCQEEMRALTAVRDSGSQET